MRMRFQNVSITKISDLPNGVRIRIDSTIVAVLSDDSHKALQELLLLFIPWPGRFLVVRMNSARGFPFHDISIIYPTPPHVSTSPSSFEMITGQINNRWSTLSGGDKATLISIFYFLRLFSNFQTFGLRTSDSELGPKPVFTSVLCARLMLVGCLMFDV